MTCCHYYPHYHMQDSDRGDRDRESETVLWRREERMLSVQVNPCHCQVVRCIGSVLSVMYLVLGLAFVTLFILINIGLVSDAQVFISLHKSFVLLAVVLSILFIGFLINIMIIVGVETDKSCFILPWLVYQ